jgi:hypothetical protein
MSQSTHHPKGLTILEILLTIALLALVVVTLIFMLRPSDERTCQLEAERLAAYLTSAAATSKMDDVVVRVSFELKEKAPKFLGTATIQTLGFAVDQLGNNWVKDERFSKFSLKESVKMTEVETHLHGLLKDGEAFVLFKSMRTTGAVVILQLNQAIRSVWIPPGGQAIEVRKGKIPLHDLYEKDRIAKLKGQSEDGDPFFNPNLNGQPQNPPVDPAIPAPATTTEPTANNNTASPTPTTPPIENTTTPANNDPPPIKDANIKDAGVQDMKMDAAAPDQFIECKMESPIEKQQQDCLSKVGHQSACVDQKCVFSIMNKAFLSVRFLSVELSATNLNSANQNQIALLDLASAMLKEVLQGVNSRSPIGFLIASSASGSYDAEQPHMIQWFQADQIFPPTIQAKDTLYGYMNLPIYPLMAQVLPPTVGCPVDAPDSASAIKKACYQISPTMILPRFFIKKIRNANRCAFEGVSLFENMNMYLQVLSLPDLNDPTMMRTVGRFMIDDTQRANPDEIRKLIDSLGNEQGSTVWAQIESYDFRPKIKMVFELAERQLMQPLMNAPYDCVEE